MEKLVSILAAEFHQTKQHVENIIALIDEGNTIPFIARYRKELTGGVDDQLLRELADRLAYLRNLEERKAEVLSSIESQDKLTDELSRAINAAVTLAELEDIYRPYRPKRRTRGTIAREKGLEPLAALILCGDVKDGDLNTAAKPFINSEKGVETVEDALAGASDIIAEDISDMAVIRKKLKELIMKTGTIVSKAAKEEDSVYGMYYEYERQILKLQSHSILALNRGEREEFLKVSVTVDTAAALNIIYNETVDEKSPTADFVKTAAEDAYSRLIFPSVEREVRNNLSDDAAEQAIKMFALNLKPLLMQPPVKNRVTLGFDPAYRTGCKIAVVDGTGKALNTTVVYPTPPHNKIDQAKETLTALIKKHGITAIAIGNGTASKESEIFIADLIRNFPDVSYMVVNEAGASVYSASKLGAEEFPDFDVSLRSAVSIARRLQDPLAELVKIDPKSIGVGQYQHDMPQARLSQSLDGVVEDCVNKVGVDLNTASASLLSKISGLSSAIAKNVVAYREENGAFTSRKELLKVVKLGQKTFTQCAGFLRVAESKNILDNTSVHPESYDAAKKLLTLCGYTLTDVEKGNLLELPNRIAELGEEKTAEYCGVGVPTIKDIVLELQKPGRDPRDELPPPLLRSDIMDMNDLQTGMVLTGTVRNVIDFGVFVDIGVHQDGLVHISEICDRFIRHPSEVLTVGDIVKTIVLKVETEKKRISLSIKQVPKE